MGKTTRYKLIHAHSEWAAPRGQCYREMRWAPCSANPAASMMRNCPNPFKHHGQNTFEERWHGLCVGGPDARSWRMHMHGRQILPQCLAFQTTKFVSKQPLKC